MIILLIIASLAVIILFLLYMFTPYVVCGDSMYPTYKDGDVVLTTKIFLHSHLKKGDVLIYRPPTDDSEREVIKRISYIVPERDLLNMLGDNSDVSFDSRYYGYVPISLVRAKVLFSRKQEVNCDE